METPITSLKANQKLEVVYSLSAQDETGNYVKTGTKTCKRRSLPRHITTDEVLTGKYSLVENKPPQWKENIDKNMKSNASKT